MFEQLTIFALLEQESLITILAGHGSGYCNGKERIRLAAHEKSDSEFVSFLRKEYGVGGYSLRWQNHRGFVNYNGSGITYQDWDSNTAEKYTYKQLAKEIKRLIADGQY